jgi:hypothetical protein
VQIEEELDPNTNQMKVVKRKVVRKPVAPNPTSLIFKLCNEDPTNYKNVNKVEVKGQLDGSQTVNNIHGLDPKTVKELAKAIVNAKASASK